ncbi:hypothetical protein CDAR_106771 [Caerostris darwini]|uniref:Uncharacterized protein n=1 Tax=Caerostris darwini TaxID=1538125 RepID=A0AAV4MPJ2_9ARAC|nr:hypothetical protein CDAR_106771 [Caerostris darwini]
MLTEAEYASVEHFAYTLFTYKYGDSEAFKIIVDHLDHEECLTLLRAENAIRKMDDICGKIFEWYFVKLKEDEVLHSKTDLVKFLLVKSFHFCRSPSFYNFLLVCLFMCRPLKSRPRCLLLLQVVAKCLYIVFNKRYADFFKANGGLIGMRKYFDEIHNEDLRLFIYRHANSENGGVLIPTFKDVLDIVTEFDGCDFRYFDLGASGLGYLYDYYSEEESLIVKDKIKLSPLPQAVVVEDENKKLELLFERLGISSNQIVIRARTRCSYCGEKCFKYLMFQLCVR